MLPGDNQGQTVKEADRTNESVRDAIQVAQVAEIVARLDSIEERLRESQQLGQRQWIYSIGFGGVATGAGMVTSGASLSNLDIVYGGMFTFFLGFPFMMFSSMKKPRQKNMC